MRERRLQLLSVFECVTELADVGSGLWASFMRVRVQVHLSLQEFSIHSSNSQLRIRID